MYGHEGMKVGLHDEHETTILKPSPRVLSIENRTSLSHFLHFTHSDKAENTVRTFKIRYPMFGSSGADVSRPVFNFLALELIFSSESSTFSAVSIFRRYLLLASIFAKRSGLMSFPRTFISVLHFPQNMYSQTKTHCNAQLHERQATDETRSISDKE